MTGDKYLLLMQLRLFFSLTYIMKRWLHVYTSKTILIGYTRNLNFTVHWEQNVVRKWRLVGDSVWLTVWHHGIDWKSYFCSVVKMESKPPIPPDNLKSNDTCNPMSGLCCLTKCRLHYSPDAMKPVNWLTSISQRLVYVHLMVIRVGKKIISPFETLLFVIVFTLHLLLLYYIAFSLSFSTARAPFINHLSEAICTSPVTSRRLLRFLVKDKPMELMVTD